MLLPTSGVELSPLSPFLCAFAISALCSCSGVSGAFLLLPYQFSILGYTLPGVSATNQIFNILACPAGVWRYAREGRLIMPLALTIALGSLPGVLLGAWTRAVILPGAAQFRLFAAAVLLYLAIRMLRGQRGSKKGKGGGKMARGQDRAEWEKRGDLLILKWQGEQWEASRLKIFLASLVTGMVGGIYGIGGGAMLSPILVSFFGLPLHLLAGATLFGTFATSIFGLATYILMAKLLVMPSLLPDFTLGLLLGLGGIPGMYCGAMLQKYLDGALLKKVLAILILITGLFYIGQSLSLWLK